MELELKLLVDSKHKDALIHHPLLFPHGTSKPREQTLSDTYFDTPDLQIWASGSGLRVRGVDGSGIQNMKSGGSVNGGLYDRNEWESPVKGPVPELALLRHIVRQVGWPCPAI